MYLYKMGDKVGTCVNIDSDVKRAVQKILYKKDMTMSFYVTQQLLKSVNRLVVQLSIQLENH